MTPACERGCRNGRARRAPGPAAAATAQRPPAGAFAVGTVVGVAAVLVNAAARGLALASASVWALYSTMPFGITTTPPSLTMKRRRSSASS